jgi:hypothetical protein
MAAVNAPADANVLIRTFAPRIRDWFERHDAQSRAEIARRALSPLCSHRWEGLIALPPVLCSVNVALDSPADQATCAVRLSHQAPT